MEDYSGDVKVVKGLNIANLVLGILLTSACFIGMLAIGLGWLALDSVIDYAMDDAAIQELHDDDELDAIFHGHKAGHAYGQCAQVVDAVFDDSLIPGLRGLEGYLDDGNLSPEELQDLLNDSDSDFANDALHGVALISMLVLQVVLGFELLVGVFFIVAAALAMRSCKHVETFKRDFVMAIIAACLALITGNIPNVVLFILSAVFIHRVRKKAGFAGAAPAAVDATATPVM